VNHAHVKRTFPGSEPPKNTASGRFEGVYPILWRRLSEKNGESKQLEPYFDIAECPDCKGERLGALSRQVTVNHTRLPELSLFSLESLSQWIDGLEASLSARQRELVCAYLLDIKTKLNRFLKVGLGYLTPDRQTVTLSGGELQRLRLAAALDCELSGILYILDEPTAGLHPKDTQGLLEILKRLRDLGNSVLIIEHDTDVMASADCTKSLARRLAPDTIIPLLL
jgi:excinuclease ABC subunit A